MMTCAISSAASESLETQTAGARGEHVLFFWGNHDDCSQKTYKKHSATAVVFNYEKTLTYA